MSEKNKTPASDLFDQALENYEQALRAGVKIHEEAGKYWAKIMTQASAPQDWQKHLAAIADDAIPTSQKNMEDYLAFLERNSRASVDLLRKGIAAAKSTGMEEGQGKLVDFCESSLNALKSSAQAIVDINVNAASSWFVLMRKTAGEATGQKAATH